MVSKKDIEKFDKDNDLWESKKLGASEEHAQAAPPELEKALDDATGLQLLSFRIQQSVVGQLKELAKLEGIGYQPLMRRILTNWVRDNEYKLEHLRAPADAVKLADELFAQAIKLKEEIANLPALSNQRIFAETAFNNALSESNSLYFNVLEKADPVLKRHVSLRLSQIADVIQQ